MTKGIEKNSQEKDFCSSRKSLKKNLQFKRTLDLQMSHLEFWSVADAEVRITFLRILLLFPFSFFYALTSLTPIASAVGNEYLSVSQYVSCCHYPYSTFPFFIADRKSRVVAFTFPGISVSSSTIIRVAP